MKTRGLNSGFTLIEMVVVVAIIAILISMVFGIATRVEEQGKIRLCKDTLALIDNALEQFRDFGYEYKHDDYAGLAFPLDCNNFNAADLRGTIQVALNLPLLSVGITADPNQQDNSSSEALYFFLNQIPDCRTTLDKIDKSLLSNKSNSGTAIDVSITIGVNTDTKPFTRIIDPWKMPFRYDYYPDYADYLIKYPTGTWPLYLVYRNDAKLAFPVITSAGPDKRFGTKDDITNR